MYPNYNQPDFSQPGMPQGYMNPNDIYAANNQYLMNSGQNAIADATRTALNNFQQQMATTLQGTMAAGMSVYNTSQSVAQRAKEHVYQDALLTSSGGYAMERSRFRDVLWGTGIAGSDFGRTWKIGGRRPEFMTMQEQNAQMQRSAHHRREEMVDALIAGGTTIGGDLLGMGMGTFGMTGAAAFAVPILGGIAVSEVARSMVQPWLDKRKATREMLEFTEVADMNHGIGQRRIDAHTSRNLALSFLEHDVSKAKYIPFVGGILAGRLETETKEFKTFKDMAQMGMFRDADIQNVDEIKNQVKRTVEVMDKFAGLMNTTREAILQIKGKMKSMGIDDLQQNTTLESMARFHNSTGYSFDQAASINDNFIGLGRQLGLYSASNGGLQGRFGLQQTAALKALQEAGMIDRMEDPGTLAQNEYINATQRIQTTAGKVMRHGGGSTTKTRNYYANRGGGNNTAAVVLGMTLEGMQLGGDDVNPYDAYANDIRSRFQHFLKTTGDTRTAFTAVLNSEKTPEGQRQALRILSGQQELGDALSYFSATRGKGNKIFYEDNDHGTFKLGDLLSYVNKQSGRTLGSYTDRDQLAKEQSIQDDMDTLATSDLITENGNESLYGAFKDATYEPGIWGTITHQKEGALAPLMRRTYFSRMNGTFSQQEKNAAIEQILSNPEVRKTLDKDPATARKQAEQMINTAHHKYESKEHGMNKTIKHLRSLDKTEQGFVRGYKDDSVLSRRASYNYVNAAMNDKDSETAGLYNSERQLKAGLEKIALSSKGKAIFSKLAGEIQTSVGNKAWTAETASYVMSELEKNGLMNLASFKEDMTGPDGQSKINTLEAMFRDAHKGINYSEFEDSEKQISIAKNYANISKNSSGVQALKNLNIKNQGDYEKAIASYGGRLGQIKDHTFNWSKDNINSLVNEMVAATGITHDAATSAVQSLYAMRGSKGNDKDLQWMVGNLMNMTQRVVTDEDRKKISDSKNGIIGPESEAISKFSAVLSKLADALNAK